MHTAVVLSRPRSVKWTQLSQTNVNVIDFFFFSLYSEWLDFMVLIKVPAASAVSLFVISVYFPNGGRLTTANVIYIQGKNGYFFRHVP